MERTHHERRVVERDDARAKAIYQQHLDVAYRRGDRVFAWLMAVQWVAGVLLALIFSPRSWEGRIASTHVHVYVAVFVGAALSLPAILLAVFRPGWVATRHTVAVAQMLWSGLFIHLTGGRIETHFHIFGSLAFLAFYRDLRLLITATLAVASDHVIRGWVWPDSVYGITNPEWWRFIEHAFWVMFENVILVVMIRGNRREMKALAGRQAAMEGFSATIERKVEERTSELEASNTRSRKMEIELRQAQKLESVGRLAAGVAHEINTPVQFVSDSVLFVRDAVGSLFGLVEKLRAVGSSLAEGGPAAEAAARTAEAEQAADLPYLIENVPKALERSLEGLGRVAKIVRSMKEFAHPDRKEQAPADLNRAIESTLTIARTEYKYVADVETDLGELPPVVCHLGDINQVILNIVINAAHAIGDVVKGTDRKGSIKVRSRRDGKAALITISDTGGGIPEKIRDRIFDPFFTTKPVGRGTGQGLAIARSVVVDMHGGELDFESVVGQGTTFIVRIPIDGKPSPASVPALSEAPAPAPALL